MQGAAPLAAAAAAPGLPPLPPDQPEALAFSFNPGEILANALKGLFDEVDRRIEQDIGLARDATVQVELEAARELLLVMQNFKAVYSDLLSKTVDQLEGAVKESLSDMEAVATRLLDRGERDLDDIMGSIELLWDSLPFSDKRPRLRAIQPKCLVFQQPAVLGRFLQKHPVPEGVAPNSVIVHFRGRFPNIAQSEVLTPKLKVGDIECPTFGHTVREFAAAVPFEAFKGDGKSIVFKVADLIIPWDNTPWIHWGKTIEKPDFKIGLCALPVMAGRVRVFYTSETKRRERQHKSVNSERYRGDPYYGREQTHQFDPWHVRPDDGWRIDEATVPDQPIEAPGTDTLGNHWIKRLSKSEQEAVYSVTVACDSGKHMGRITYQCNFEQFRDVVDRHTESDSFWIGWNQRRVVSAPDGKEISKVVFEAFDGTSQEYLAPPHDGPGVLRGERQRENGPWTIWAEPPRELQ